MNKKLVLLTILILVLIFSVSLYAEDKKSPISVDIVEETEETKIIEYYKDGKKKVPKKKVETKKATEETEEASNNEDINTDDLDLDDDKVKLSGDEALDQIERRKDVIGRKKRPRKYYKKNPYEEDEIKYERRRNRRRRRRHRRAGRGFFTRPNLVKLWLDLSFSDSFTNDYYYEYQLFFTFGLGIEFNFTKNFGIKLNGGVSINSDTFSDMMIYWYGDIFVTYHFFPRTRHDFYVEAGLGCTGNVIPNYENTYDNDNLAIRIYPAIGVGYNFFITRNFFVGIEGIWKPSFINLAVPDPGITGWSALARIGFSI